MSLVAIVSLLQTALVLLTLVSGHPELPQSLRDTAAQVAQQAITQATQALASNNQNISSWQKVYPTVGSQSISIRVPKEYLPAVKLTVTIGSYTPRIPCETCEVTPAKSVTINGAIWYKSTILDAACINNRQFVRNITSNSVSHIVIVNFEACEGSAISFPSEILMGQILGTFALDDTTSVTNSSLSTSVPGMSKYTRFRILVQTWDKVVTIDEYTSPNKTITDPDPGVGHMGHPSSGSPLLL